MTENCNDKAFIMFVENNKIIETLINTFIDRHKNSSVSTFSDFTIYCSITYCIIIYSTPK